MYKVYVDAAYNPKQQSAAIACNAIKDGKQHTQTHYLPHVQDNHEAEFQAMLLALQLLETLDATQELVTLYSDSKIVVQSIEKRYAKDEVYAKWLTEILEKMDRHQLLFINWIADKDNKAADHLARQALYEGDLHAN
ncbi:MAG: reverse transcriptase-like protein [Aerococcaceae bacterium]|nr:reverse transcriptase-like protein [Aerococcaceae bacterium]